MLVVIVVIRLHANLPTLKGKESVCQCMYVVGLALEVWLRYWVWPMV